ncbi:MAG: hypothetical protein EBY80_07575 [Actinobacteria bacterium]|nr:hypothetical protein [Actinomycetota bacterium]
MTRTRLLRFLSLIIVAATSSVLLPATARAWVPIEPTPGQPQLFVGPCQTASDVDCIESIGAFINGAWVDGVVTGRTAPTATGGVCCHEWQIPGLVNEDGFDRVETMGQLEYPGTQGTLPRFQFEIHASTQDNFRVPYESGSNACTTNRVNGVCVRYGNTQRDVRFRAVVRLGWLLPSVVTPKAGDSLVTTERLAADGASRVTVEGIPYDILGVDTATVGNVNDPNARGAWKVNRFAFVVIDTRYAWTTQCSEKPAVIVADNSWRPSVPAFNASTGVLSLRIDNPHYDTDGTTVWMGKYQARIPLETARCMWGPTVNENTQFTFTISDPQDAANTATASVVVAGDAVVITATNFHYSGPTLSVRAVASTPNLPATGAGRMTPEILLAAVLVMMGLVIIGSRRRAID